MYRFLLDGRIEKTTLISGSDLKYCLERSYNTGANMVHNNKGEQTRTLVKNLEVSSNIHKFDFVTKSCGLNTMDIEDFFWG
jgi:hypothetical protein